MSVKLIAYDFGGPENSASYSALIAKIKTLGSCVKPVESFWLVDSALDCVTIRNILGPFLDNNDRLLVTECSLVARASYNLPFSIAQWMSVHTA